MTCVEWGLIRRKSNKGDINLHCKMDLVPDNMADTRRHVINTIYIV